MEHIIRNTFKNFFELIMPWLDKSNIEDYIGKITMDNGLEMLMVPADAKFVNGIACWYDYINRIVRWVSLDEVINLELISVHFDELCYRYDIIVVGNVLHRGELVDTKVYKDNDMVIEVYRCGARYLIVRRNDHIFYADDKVDIDDMVDWAERVTRVETDASVELALNNFFKK